MDSTGSKSCSEAVFIKTVELLGSLRRREYVKVYRSKCIPVLNKTQGHGRTEIVEVKLHTFLISALDGGK